jgi:hypothetical protein
MNPLDTEELKESDFNDAVILLNEYLSIKKQIDLYRSYLKKFGITVAELTLFMQKQE